MSDRKLTILVLAGLALLALAGAIGLATRGRDGHDFLALAVLVVGLLVPSPLSKTSTPPDV